jgi:hypothetical protein
MTCPACSAPLADTATECSSCGIVVAKWRRQVEDRRPRLSGAHPTKDKRGRLSSTLPILAVTSLAAAVAVGVYWYSSAPRDEGVNVSYQSTDEEAGTLLRKASRAPGFDVAYELPTLPAPVATDGKELIVGAFRLRPRGDDGFLAQQLNDSLTNVGALTWNGKEFIGISGGAFTTHARNTLRLLASTPAPKGVTCIAWDGRSYWAASAKSLYKLDPDFKVLATSDAPAPCHGLAWDGTYLWLADDSIHVIDVAGEKPRVLHTEKAPLANLSGVVAFKGDIWMTESDHNLLQRLAPMLRAAWTSGGAPAAVTTAPAAAGAPYNLAALRRQLRSSDFRERVRARVELQKLGAAIEFDRHESHFVDRDPKGFEVIDWSIELRDGAIFGSWKLWFGPATGGSYTITVHPPAGGAEVTKEFTAKAGENAMSDVLLAEAVAPGDYRVDVSLSGGAASSLALKSVSAAVAAPRPE